MLSYRFSNQTQKDVQLTILRDLLKDHADDQLAKTVLSNSIAAFEATMVSGDLDALIERTNSWYRRTTRLLSVFFVALGLAEMVFAWIQWREGGIIRGLGPLFFGVVALSYCAALQGMWRIQRNYHTQLKRLEDMQLELPSTPVRLQRVS